MKLLIILLVALTMAFSVNSQNKIKVETLEKNMSQGRHTAFTVLIPESSTQEIETLWKKYVNNRPADERFKNFSTQVGNIFKSKEKRTSRDRLKTDKTGDELLVRSIELDKISNYPMDIYALIIQLPAGSQLNAFFQYTDSVFIDPSNTDPDRLASITDFMYDFGVDAYRSVVDKNIKLANRDISKEENVLKELNASISRAEKAIMRDQELIQEYHDKIAQLRNDSITMIETIDLKRKEFSEMKEDSLDYEATKADLKSMEREKARVPREIRTLKARIKSKELDIKSARHQIAENEIEIKNQEAVIEEKQQIAEELIKEKGEIQ